MHCKTFPFAILTIFLACFCSLSAQDNDRNSLTLNFGVSNLHLLDEHANFLIFRGTGIAPSLNYQRITSNGIHQVNGSFFLNKLTASSDNFKTELYGGQLRYAYLRNVMIDPAELSIGLTFSSVYFKTDYYFYNRVSWLKAIESWYWSHSAGPAFQLKKELHRNEFVITAFIPVLSNASRPKYSSSGDYNYQENDWDVKVFGETVFNPGINTRLLYSRQLSAKFIASAEYEFFYSQCKNRELIRLYMNNVRVGLTWCF